MRRESGDYDGRMNMLRINLGVGFMDIYTQGRIFYDRDDRIGENYTHIRIPSSYDIAAKRYRDDPLLCLAIDEISTKHGSYPQEILYEYTGTELKFKNELLGIGVNDSRLTDGWRDYPPLAEEPPDEEQESLFQRVMDRILG